MEERNRWSRRNRKLIGDSAERSGGGRLGETTWANWRGETVGGRRRRVRFFPREGVALHSVARFAGGRWDDVPTLLLSKKDALKMGQKCWHIGSSLIPHV
jgi:hypothetical protein